MRLLYLSFFISSIFLYSCAGNKSTGGSKKKRIKTEATVLSDSLNHCWKIMIESDNAKMADIKRLLDEVSYTQSHNTAELERLRNKQQALINKRYHRETMTSAQIDAYDMATDSLLRETFALVNETPEMETHSITSDLIEEIQKEDNNVIIFRVQHDQWAKKYNEFIDKNSARLQKMGSPYKDYKKQPLFELPQ